MTKPTLRSLALLFACLVIMLPIITAQQLNVQQYSGRAGVNGFVTRNDALTVKVTTPTAVTAEQVRIFSDDVYFFFDTCTAQGTASQCSYTADLGGFFGSDEYVIKLFESPTSQHVLGEKNIIVVSDILAPIIKTLEIDSETSTTGNVQIHYVAEDRAFDVNEANVCSGLKEISFTFNNKKLLSESGGELCAKENTFVHLISTSGFERGPLCAVATDRMGQTSATKCVPFTIDSIAPAIQKIELFDEDGTALTHAHTGEVKTAHVAVTILGNNNDIDFSTVMADLTRLNPALGSRRADDVTGNVYTWANVPVTTPSTCSVPVTASDLHGNTDTKTLACSIGVDDTAPITKSITTGFSQNGKPAIGTSGTVIVEFEETGAGFDKENAFLELGSIGLEDKRPADDCHKEGGNAWKCMWNVKPAVSGTKTISVHPDTADDVGNKARTLSQEVLIDREPPTVVGIEKVRLIHNTVELGDVTVAGDTAEFYINARDFDLAFANFSDVSDAENVETDECIGEDVKTCKFSTVIQNSGPYLANLSFTFSDTAGNKAVKKYYLFVYGVADDENPNYWTLGKVTCSPKLIDRSTASLIGHPVFCALPLETKNRNAVPVATILKDPTLCTGNTTGFISDIHLRNSRSKKPVLAITLEPTDFNVNEIDINCPVQIFTRAGTLFTQVPEEETALFSLKFYNLPYGELGKNVEEQIDDAVEDAEDTLKWVGTLEKFVGLAGKICQIKGIISSVLGSLDAILGGLALASQGAWAIPGGQGFATSAESARAAICETSKGPLESFFMGDGLGLKGSFGVLDTFCGIIECRSSYDKEKGIWSWVLGGGMPWCKPLQNIADFGGVLGDVSTKDIDATYKGYADEKSKPEQSLVDVKDSLFWSTMCLCPAGILHNLNKYRQIQCRYATCMLQEFKEQGIPRSYCKDIKAQQTCQFVVGELFSILPLTVFFDKVIKALQDIITNPIAAIAAVMGCLCGGCPGVPTPDLCLPSPGGATGVLYTACITTKTVSKISDAVASIAQMTKIAKKDYWKTSNDWCEQMEDLTEKQQTQESTPEEATEE